MVFWPVELAYPSPNSSVSISDYKDAKEKFTTQIMHVFVYFAGLLSIAYSS